MRREHSACGLRLVINCLKKRMLRGVGVNGQSSRPRHLHLAFTPPSGWAEGCRLWGGPSAHLLGAMMLNNLEDPTQLLFLPDSLSHLLPPDSVYLQQRQMHQHQLEM